MYCNQDQATQDFKGRLKVFLLNIFFLFKRKLDMAHESCCNKFSRKWEQKNISRRGSENKATSEKPRMSYF